jgi:hypothetical protein
VRTADLFAPAKYLKENPSDTDYAKQCRDAFFLYEGEVVTFPAPPSVEKMIVAESKQSKMV